MSKKLSRRRKIMDWKKGSDSHKPVRLPDPLKHCRLLHTSEEVLHLLPHQPIRDDADLLWGFLFFFSLVNHFWPEFKSFLIKKIDVNHPTRASLTFSVSQMLLDLSQPSHKVIKSIALQFGETADNIPRACYSGAARCWWRRGEQKVRRWQSGVSRHSRVSRHTTRKVAQISLFFLSLFI